MSHWEMEDFWDDLLACIEEERVVPIIGTDLLRVMHEGREIPLYRLVAEKLASRLRVDPASLPSDYALNDVVLAYLQHNGRREEIYTRIRAVMRELAVEPPLALRQLAEIAPFRLFVTLSCDWLLAQALNEVRYGGAERTEQLGFSPARAQDLSPGSLESKGGNRPTVVYNLFGKVSAAPDYVITEEDSLEFLHALQSESKRPQRLFDELQNKHLLIIGCGFPDWLARFFIRTLKSQQLSAQRGETEILVDTQASHDQNLVLFLENFSYGTKVMPLPAAAFVAELSQRWRQAHPAPVAGQAVPGAKLVMAEPEADAVPDMQPGSIFLSYGKEDYPMAAAIANALEEVGLDVWFDRQRLEAGDLYDQKIKRHIRACSLFLPLISQNTLRRVEGYFRMEWKLATDRALQIADHVPFIIPVALDDVPPYSPDVPERFQEAQWTMLHSGEVSDSFVTRMIKLVRDYRKREQGLA